MFKEAKEIQNSLKQLDNKLSVMFKGVTPMPKVRLILAGGAAVMLGHGGKRWTEDIDAMQTKYKNPIVHAIMSEDIHFVTDSIAFLHPDYMDRVVFIETGNNLEIYKLSKEDLIIAKAARGTLKDFYDIFSSNLSDNVDIARIRALFTEGMDYWTIGNSTAYFKDKLEDLCAMLLEKQLLNDSKVIPLLINHTQILAAKGMIQNSPEITILLYLLGVRKREELTVGQINKAWFFLNNAGTSITSDRAEVAIGEVLRYFCNKHGICQRANKRNTSKTVLPATAQEPQVQSLFKLFKTIAGKTSKEIGSSNLLSLETTFATRSLPGR